MTILRRCYDNIRLRLRSVFDLLTTRLTNIRIEFIRFFRYLRHDTAYLSCTRDLSHGEKIQGHCRKQKILSYLSHELVESSCSFLIPSGFRVYRKF